MSADPSTRGRTRSGCRPPSPEAGIAYEHQPELAPTTELRQVQYAEDDRRGVGKRSRRELAAEYTRRYTTEILDRADLAPVVAALPSTGTAALFCVESDPEACHRSLIAQRLSERHHVRSSICARREAAARLRTPVSFPSKTTGPSPSRVSRTDAEDSSRRAFRLR